MGYSDILAELLGGSPAPRENLAALFADRGGGGSSNLAAMFLSGPPLGSSGSMAQAFLPTPLVGRGGGGGDQTEASAALRSIREKRDAQQRAQQPGQGPQTGYAGAVNAAGGPAAQIVAMARQKFGDEGARAVQAVLTAEGGLGGAVGDRDISPVGSHGPFQFYGPGGQLDNYARARGVDLATAGQMARSNPLDAAQWAFENYLAGPLSSGRTGDDLLNAVLAVQNPGALRSPQHLQRYQTAYQNQPVAFDAQAAPALAQGLASPAPSAAGTPVRVGGQQWQIAFDFDQPYGAAQWAGGPARHRGVDLVIPGRPQGGRGETYTAFAPGRVAAITNDPAGGQGIIVQTDDGLYHRYFHNDRVLVREGQQVNTSTPLGVVGATGTEGFPHLHFEISRRINGDPIGQLIDPRSYVREGGR